MHSACVHACTCTCKEIGIHTISIVRPVTSALLCTCTQVARAQTELTELSAANAELAKTLAEADLAAADDKALGSDTRSSDARLVARAVIQSVK